MDKAQYKPITNMYSGMSDGNLSDVIEAIQTTDPDSMVMAMDNEHVQQYVEILEQPASKALRFRYECEGRSAGSIPGVHSTPENKTFPSIRIVGYKGRAMVVVSCVTKDAPYRPHPHNLVGKEVCRQGVCTVEVPAGNMVVTFSNLGIQCVKKKDIEDALKVRQELRVDPFRTGFEHRRHPIDLNAVRLCFQVFLEGSQKGKFNKSLQPIVSEPIYDKKAMSDLVICKLSHCSASVNGGLQMILLCEKVAKEDIKVRFFEQRDEQVVWEGFGDFQPTDVHKQTAIAFKTPKYRSLEVEDMVQVFIQLQRPSDNATSEPRLFHMLPLGTDDPDSLRQKRRKINNGSGSISYKLVAGIDKHQPFNIKAESPGRVSPFGGQAASTSAGSFQGASTSAGSFLQPVRPSHSNMQTLRPKVSPGRTPSPMEWNSYTLPPMQQQQQQYQLNIPSMMPQLNIPVPTNVQTFGYVPDHQPEPNLVMLNSVTPENQAVMQPVNNIDTAETSYLLDMDNQQFADFNLVDLIDFEQIGANLSANLSIGLSISDSIQPEASSGEERNSMTEQISSINQELSALNKIYKPNRENDGSGLD